MSMRLKEIQKLFSRARSEGRLCNKCGWMITVARWREGHKLCYNCEDAYEGVARFDPYDLSAIKPLKLIKHLK